LSERKRDLKKENNLARAVRQVRGDLSQQAFAHFLGVALVSISRYEHGASPDLSILRKLYDRAVSRNDLDAAGVFQKEIEKRMGVNIRFELTLPSTLSRSVAQQALEKFGAAMFRSEASDYEDRILSAVRRFLRDEKTSSRERRILEILIGDYFVLREDKAD
jgi:transcriptional regulator with XRE-family HTH domain